MLTKHPRSRQRMAVAHTQLCSVIRTNLAAVQANCFHSEKPQVTALLPSLVPVFVRRRYQTPLPTPPSGDQG
jgi:hypothetical protein